MNLAKNEEGERDDEEDTEYEEACENENAYDHEDDLLYLTREQLRIVDVGDIIPIAKADAIEVAKVGGWSAVVKKGIHHKGSKAVYFEID